MSNDVELCVFDVVRNSRGETVLIAEPKFHAQTLKIGDFFLTCYNTDKEEVLKGYTNPKRLNIRKISLRVVRIEIERHGPLDMEELPGTWGRAGELHVVGSGLEEVTPGCLLHT